MNIKALIFATAFMVPLQQPSDWQLLQYSSIAPNEVNFGLEGMTIDVMASASPIIYLLPEPQLVRHIEVTGRLNDLLTLDSAKQGLENHDDFSLKIGLVVAGDKTLNTMQKLFAADWVKTLYELAPEGDGINSIYFLNAVQNSARLGLQRQHPLSDLIFENNVWLLDKPGDFAMTHTLDQPRKVIAIWLSIDGDDSQSVYSTLIKSLHLES